MRGEPAVGRGGGNRKVSGSESRRAAVGPPAADSSNRCSPAVARNERTIFERRHRAMKPFTVVVAGLGMLSFTAIAHALPLCGTGFGPCRAGLEFGAFAGGLAVEGALAKPKDGAGAVGHFTAAFKAFEDANSKLADPSLSDDDKCAQASNEDERGLTEAFRGVRDSSKLKLGQFTSQNAFDTLRNFNRLLTSFIIEVVAFNIDEVEAL